uniref:Putative constitutive coactivator n=1 Tax=Xenopsylla cheopis TaxID=163159 RepID=A0A6M2DJN7_XENCH
MSGLQSFMERDPTVFYKINMVREIDNFRKKTGKTPLLVLHGPCSRQFFGKPNKKKFLTGGQFKLYKKNVDKFVDFFQELDVKIVAFFDGCKIDRMQDRWIQKKRYYIQNSYELLDAIDHNEVNNNRTQLPCNISNFIQSCLKKKCEVIFSTFEESDSEIITYAKKHDALAVFSQDADFVIAQADFMYWSYKDIDYESQTTYVYDRKMLARALGLNVEQLPLLRTMIGNDYVLEPKLQTWFKKLGIRQYKDLSFDRHQKIVKVARQIKNCNNTIDSYRHLSSRAFGTYDDYDIIKISVESYMGIGRDKTTSLSEDFQWNALLMKAVELMQGPRYLVNGVIFDILHKQTFEMNMIYEDFRKPDIPASGLLWRPIRAHIYGILLRDYPFNKTVEEWICHGGDISIPDMVEAILPTGDIEHYKLQDFWDESISTDLTEITWKLFCSSINNNLPVHRVKNINQKCIITALIILFMADKCHMNEEEINAFLMMSALCATNDDVTQYSSAHTNKINTRMLRLSTVFLRGLSTMSLFFNATCFLIPKDYILACNIFDGALLQSLYRDPNSAHSVHYEARILFEDGKRFIDEYKHLF